MGMYTEIFFRSEVDLESFTVINALGVDFDFPWPDHPFFTKPRFRHITKGGSFYFPAARHTTAEIIDTNTERMYFASFRADIKNYNNEIQSFFDWVTPHCKDNSGAGAFIGYSQYEESRELTLYFSDIERWNNEHSL